MTRRMRWTVTISLVLFLAIGTGAAMQTYFPTSPVPLWWAALTPGLALFIWLKERHWL